MAKPMKTLKLRYPMIQFLINTSYAMLSSGILWDNHESLVFSRIFFSYRWTSAIVSVAYYLIPCQKLNTQNVTIFASNVTYEYLEYSARAFL